MNDRDYDLVLFGATGFTGRLVAGHLARRTAGTTVRWAVAGRSRDRLRALADELAGRAPAVEVVDLDDTDGLRRLTARTAVVASTAGPFVRLGEPLVAACVDTTTDYADITGEPGFVALVRDRYGQPALDAGVRLVTCCGFDSVPHDLGARFTAGLLPQDTEVSVRAYVRADARFSGGTAHSALDAIASRRIGDAGRPAPGAPSLRRVHGLALRPHRAPADLDGYGVPLPTVDPAIVLRSARALPGYGRSFGYGHYALVGNLPLAAAGLAGASVFGVAAALPPTRTLLRKLLPAAGTGPSAERRARSSFSVTFVGKGGGHTVVTRVSGGDPGYDETARMLGEAALSLAQDDAGELTGALTPAMALGEPYRTRLEHQGLAFDVLAAADDDAA
ncbi:saccharopine dehydrogenase family protein [Egicoccus halophilus]|uniref:Saccharopine dehydrogenase n=1 Tax=Egicoccus halophilus TaxID=1670830 RepID=A0A8J3ABH0_9ACTN|nr:saccharopine dehydrogenase NADP-binding domain-containing protein [Egicoccus halophilus]GGI09656.1 saccharopine dehydrogenase [Egicoccus halophilus]